MGQNLRVGTGPDPSDSPWATLANTTATLTTVDSMTRIRHGHDHRRSNARPQRRRQSRSGRAWVPLRPTVGERGSIRGSRSGSGTDPPGFRGETLEKAKLHNPLFTRGRTMGIWKCGVQPRISEIACWEGAAIGIRAGSRRLPQRASQPDAGPGPAQPCNRSPRYVNVQDH